MPECLNYKMTQNVNVITFILMNINFVDEKYFSWFVWHSYQMCINLKFVRIRNNLQQIHYCMKQKMSLYLCFCGVTKVVFNSGKKSICKMQFPQESKWHCSNLCFTWRTLHLMRSVFLSTSVPCNLRTEDPPKKFLSSSMISWMITSMKDAMNI